jgi:hypothetical protein
MSPTRYAANLRRNPGGGNGEKDKHTGSLKKLEGEQWVNTHQIQQGCGNTDDVAIPEDCCGLRGKARDPQLENRIEMMYLVRGVQDGLLLTEHEKNTSYDQCPEAREESTHKSCRLIPHPLANEDHASA